jgi:signal transduction histidine kinase
MKFASKSMIIALLLLTLSAIIFSLNLKQDSMKDSESDATAQIEELISGFVKTHQPIEAIDFTAVLQLYDLETLVAPKAMLPTSHKYPQKIIAALYRYSNSCNFQDVEKLDLSSSSILYKTLIWHQFICHRLANLPEDFFAKEPYLHPSGNSFAFLAFSSGIGLYTESKWISSHIRYFHIIELDKLGRDTLLTPAQLLLAKSSQETLNSLSMSQQVILDQKFLLVRRQIGDSQSEYKAFRKSEWDRFFKDEKFYPSQQNTQSDSSTRFAICVHRDGSICWQPNRVVQIDFRNVAKASAMLGLAIVLLNLAGIGIYKIRLERRNHQGRVFVLRTITHELRTPVASIELSLENFRHHYEFLPEDMQVNFMRICNDVQRLRRLIESSTQYLQSSEDGRLLILKPVLLPSLNNYIEMLLENYVPNIKLHPLSNDISCTLDPFWIGICVKNLIDNALVHGTPPVEVFLAGDQDFISISVKDAGTNPSLDLADLRKPFSKNTTSPGLGLGLTIVLHILKSMKATLHFTHSPSTFTIKLRAVNDKNPSR